MSEQLFTDQELGSIHVVVNHKARHIIMRIVDDGIRMTVPRSTALSTLRDYLDRHRTKLLQMQQKQLSRQQTIDFTFSIQTDLLQLRLIPSPRDGFYLNRQPGFCEIVCPATTDFTLRQEWLQGVITEQLRFQAKSILSQRLSNLARKHNFQYSNLKIQTSHTRWGSCSATGNINLSVFLMKLPSPLVDYVLLHELCHTVHHDHSPAFWQLMDRVTDNQSHSLRRQLRTYNTDIFPV